MAKVKSPLFSLDARGALGDSLVFQKWKGIATAKSFSIPSDPQTEAQLNHRELLRLIIDAYHFIPYNSADHSAHTLSASFLGSAMSGYNWWVRRVNAQRVDGGEVLLTWGFVVNSNVDGILNFSFASNVYSDLRLRWGYSPTLLVNNIHLPEPGEAGIYTCEITGLTPGKDVFLLIDYPSVPGSSITGIYKVRVSRSVVPPVPKITVTIDTVTYDGNLFRVFMSADVSSLLDFDYVNPSGGINGWGFTYRYDLYHFGALAIGLPPECYVKLHMKNIPVGYELAAQDIPIPPPPFP